MLTDYDKTQQAVETVAAYMNGLIAQGVDPERAIEHAALRYGADRGKLRTLLNFSEVVHLPHEEYDF